MEMPRQMCMDIYLKVHQQALFAVRSSHGLDGFPEWNRCFLNTRQIRYLSVSGQ